MTIAIYGATPPIDPGTFFTICLEAPPGQDGTVTFAADPASATPQPLTFTKGDNCTKMMMPQCNTLKATCPGHPDRILR